MTTSRMIASPKETRAAAPEESGAAGEKPPASKPQRPRPVFKTLNSRVNFVIAVTAVSMATIGILGATAAWQVGRSPSTPYFSGQDGAVSFIFMVGRATAEIAAAAPMAAAMIVILAAVVTWIMLTLGDFLITRRTRRLVHGMNDILMGDRPPGTLPAGLGEFDDLRCSSMVL